MQTTKKELRLDFLRYSYYKRIANEVFVLFASRWKRKNDWVHFFLHSSYPFCCSFYFLSLLDFPFTPRFRLMAFILSLSGDEIDIFASQNPFFLCMSNEWQTKLKMKMLFRLEIIFFSLFLTLCPACRSLCCGFYSDSYWNWKSEEWIFGGEMCRRIFCGIGECGQCWLQASKAIRSIWFRSMFEHNEWKSFSSPSHASIDVQMKMLNIPEIKWPKCMLWTRWHLVLTIDIWKPLSIFTQLSMCAFYHFNWKRFLNGFFAIFAQYHRFSNRVCLCVRVWFCTFCVRYILPSQKCHK